MYAVQLQVVLSRAAKYYRVAYCELSAFTQVFCKSPYLFAGNADKCHELDNVTHAPLCFIRTGRPAWRCKRSPKTMLVAPLRPAHTHTHLHSLTALSRTLVDKVQVLIFSLSKT